jgi:hypothetical protein
MVLAAKLHDHVACMYLGDLYECRGSAGKHCGRVCRHRLDMLRGQTVVPDMSQRLISRNDNAQVMPHFFYIILDAYARDDVLQRLYGFRSNPLTTGLEAQGFVVVADARANYTHTTLAMASVLNMDHLGQLLDLDPDSSSHHPVLRLLRRNRVVSLFQNAGYDVVNTASGYRPVDFFEGALNVSVNNEFWHEMISRVWFVKLARHMSRRLGGGDARLHEAHRDRILHALDSLPVYARLEDPQFVYAHVIAPHAPFVFTASGDFPETLSASFKLGDGPGLIHGLGIDVAGYRKMYAEQVQCLNGLVLKSVQDILRNASRPVVIILQSDHGPASTLDWNALDQVDMQERMATLSAFYLPEEFRASFTPPVSAVNTFPAVFNAVFGTQFALKPDVSHFSTWGEPFRFHDVTDYRLKMAD